MRAPAALRSLAVCALVASAAGAGLRAASAHARPVAQVDRSPCLAEGRKTASSRVLLQGESATVTIRLDYACPGETPPTDVAFVLDASQNMVGDNLKNMQNAARWLVNDLDLPNRPDRRVAVASFKSSATKMVRLSNDEHKALRAIGRPQASGGASIASGINAGVQLLFAGRRGLRVAPYEVLILISNGKSDSGCPPAQQSAEAAKSSGILVVSICVGHDCDDVCMRSLASSPRYYFPVEEIGRTGPVFSRLHPDVGQAGLASLIVSDLPASAFGVVTGSARPAPSLIDSTTGELTWTYPLTATGVVPPFGITITYRVRALAPGYRDTSLSTRYEFVDAQNRPGDGAIPSPAVQVLSPKVVPVP